MLSRRNNGGLFLDALHTARCMPEISGPGGVNKMPTQSKSADLDRVIDRAFKQVAAVLDLVFEALEVAPPPPEELRKRFMEIVRTTDPAAFAAGRSDWIERRGEEDWSKRLSRRVGSARRRIAKLEGE